MKKKKEDGERYVYDIYTTESTYSMYCRDENEVVQRCAFHMHHTGMRMEICVPHVVHILHRDGDEDEVVDVCTTCASCFAPEGRGWTGLPYNFSRMGNG